MANTEDDVDNLLNSAIEEGMGTGPVGSRRSIAGLVGSPSSSKAEQKMALVNDDDRIQKLLNLKEELKTIDVELVLKRHMDKLHLYNDLKDIGQNILGVLADKKGTTVKQLYSEFGMELDD